MNYLVLESTGKSINELKPNLRVSGVYWERVGKGARAHAVQATICISTDILELDIVAELEFGNTDATQHLPRRVVLEQSVLNPATPMQHS
jgi:hypothetical protein